MDSSRKRMTVRRKNIANDNLRMLSVNKHLHLCAGGAFKVFHVYKLFSFFLFDVIFINDVANCRTEKIVNTLVSNKWNILLTLNTTPFLLKDKGPAKLSK